MRYVWKPSYYSKREVENMDNEGLVDAFEGAVVDLVQCQNYRNHVPAKLAKQIEWMKNELCERMKIH